MNVRVLNKNGWIDSPVHMIEPGFRFFGIEVISPKKTINPHRLIFSHPDCRAKILIESYNSRDWVNWLIVGDSEPVIMTELTRSDLDVIVRLFHK